MQMGYEINLRLFPLCLKMKQFMPQKSILPHSTIFYLVLYFGKNFRCERHLTLILRCTYLQTIRVCLV